MKYSLGCQKYTHAHTTHLHRVIHTQAPTHTQHNTSPALYWRLIMIYIISREKSLGILTGFSPYVRAIYDSGHSRLVSHYWSSCSCYGRHWYSAACVPTITRLLYHMTVIKILRQHVAEGKEDVIIIIWIREYYIDVKEISVRYNILNC